MGDEISKNLRLIELYTRLTAGVSIEIEKRDPNPGVVIHDNFTLMFGFLTWFDILDT